MGAGQGIPRAYDLAQLLHERIGPVIAVAA